jgi:hypothetical protein
VIEVSAALARIWSDKERERVARSRLEAKSGGLGWWAAYDLAQRMDEAMKKLAEACKCAMQARS